MATSWTPETKSSSPTWTPGTKSSAPTWTAQDKSVETPLGSTPATLLFGLLYFVSTGAVVYTSWASPTKN